jgi:hypothetical protein
MPMIPHYSTKASFAEADDSSSVDDDDLEAWASDDDTRSTDLSNSRNQASHDTYNECSLRK